MLDHQQAIQNTTIYGWPKALVASSLSLSGDIVAQITDIPWSTVIMAIGASIPPVLKIIFDHRLRSKAQNDQSQLQWIARLHEEREAERMARLRAEHDLEVIIENSKTHDDRHSQEVIDILSALTVEVQIMKEKHGQNQEPKPDCRV